jgi:hypothetical protein
MIEFLIKEINFAPSVFDVYSDFYMGTSSVWHWVNISKMEVRPLPICLKITTTTLSRREIVKVIDKHPMKRHIILQQWQCPPSHCMPHIREVLPHPS